MTHHSTFEIRDTLRQRGAVESEPDIETGGLLLVSTEGTVGSWTEGQSRCGSDHVELTPAIFRGERAWLITRTWYASPRYCGSGTEDDILDFEAGAKLLLQHGAFEHLWYDADAAESSL